MSDEHSQKSGLKQKAVHEFEEFTGIFLYLAFFFCALTTYSMLLLNKSNVSYFTYGAALINALVIAKVILIGEYAHLGKKHEAKPLLLSAVYKAFLFRFARVRLSHCRGTDQAAFGRRKYDDGVARDLSRRPCLPQPGCFLYFHSALCLQGFTAGSGGGKLPRALFPHGCSSEIRPHPRELKQTASRLCLRSGSLSREGSQVWVGPPGMEYAAPFPSRQKGRWDSR